MFAVEHVDGFDCSLDVTHIKMRDKAAKLILRYYYYNYYPFHLLMKLIFSRSPSSSTSFLVNHSLSGFETPPHSPSLCIYIFSYSSFLLGQCALFLLASFHLFKS